MGIPPHSGWNCATGYGAALSCVTICPGVIHTPIYKSIAGDGRDAEEFLARLAAPVVFPKRLGRPDEFGHLVRTLVENDYMNAEVVRFDGGIRFQPK